MSSIGILGAGTWGTALCSVLAGAGHSVTVWSAIGQEIDALSATYTHKNLPGLSIPRSVTFEKSLFTTCDHKDVLIFAVPSVYVRSTARSAAPFIKKGQIIADVAKGMEADTLFTMTQIIADELKDVPVRLVALSGPTHAEEVAMNLPTTIVSASADAEAAQTVQALFADTCMRVYTGSDVLGVELCGAMKNIMALASGMALGLGYGDNTKAALITRGMAEITRLGIAIGCKPETFYGLAGIGDLIVTATSRHSRNNRAGFLIGQGSTPDEAVREVGMVVEGMYAIPAAMELSRKYNVEMPIVASVHRIVQGELTPAEAVRALMARNTKAE